MSETDREFFRQIPVWTAGYPYNPDDFNEPPPAYIPDQTKWGPVWLWQYSEDGIIDGIIGEVDLNWMSPEILDYIGEPTQPPPTGENMYVYKIPQADIMRAHVTGFSTRKTVAEVAAEFHETCLPGNHSIVINGDGWSGSQSNSIWYSEGKALNTNQLDWRPRVVFGTLDNMALRFRGKPYYYPDNIADYNTFSLTRRLVVGGAINPLFSENGEKNARCGFGITANREFVIVGADGDDMTNRGVTITDIGSELIRQGVIEGGDGDGGGSFTLAYDGQVINDWYNDGQPMRAVVNHLCLEIKGEPEPPPTDVTPPDEFTARWKDADGNVVVTRDYKRV